MVTILAQKQLIVRKKETFIFFFNSSYYFCRKQIFHKSPNYQIFRSFFSSLAWFFDFRFRFLFYWAFNNHKNLHKKIYSFQFSNIQYIPKIPIVQISSEYCWLLTLLPSTHFAVYFFQFFCFSESYLTFVKYLSFIKRHDLLCSVYLQSIT